MSLILLAFLPILASARDNVGLIIGGYGASNTIELVTKDDRCTGNNIKPPFPVAPGASSAWVAEYIDGFIYLCGGQNLDQSRDCYEFDVFNGARFQKICRLNIGRRYPSSVVINGQVVIMGGYNDDGNNDGWLDSVEVMVADDSGAECKFEMKPEWTLPRGMYNFCLVPDGDILYSIGGQVNEPFDDNALDAFDILDTKTNTWTSGPKLPYVLEAAGCLITEVEGSRGIMVVGGCNRDCKTNFDKTLFYDFATEEWRELSARLTVARNHPGVIEIDGKPTVIGGYNMYGLRNEIEYFDGSTWVKRSDSLERPRYAFGLPKDLPASAVSCN